ncbi:putative C2 domain-containing protein [Helianthus annuus]|uniref:C2 domain-containing protein n=1 Tax=Helianthus annuus TaxID=4232 RepID=A0A9K3IU64_HELAN|nr:protein SRC2 homolog [Helianthus annuus]KAF5803058.1 putative C2 domain-containing protein [Helianthus annuus]KAJ0574122.1 putative C2 domain-containing protein [Helianthus annuus]KAJ0738456.1 putative C2 domain-containing protein [Helianthus annuus]KAJ0741342.1 putative C2 domain-containing protein [Helianthus annuus]KAJ0912585.1 putative C2 domain-containing protein [Helianthus annuus]
MECRKLELTIISANDLREVRRLFKMKVYAKVFIGGNQEMEKRTPVDNHGQTNPAWNYTMKYSISESWLKHHGTIKGGPKPNRRWAGAPPGKKNLVLNSVENPVRTPWNFSSAPLGIFRPHP